MNVRSYRQLGVNEHHNPLFILRYAVLHIIAVVSNCNYNNFIDKKPIVKLDSFAKLGNSFTCSADDYHSIHKANRILKHSGQPDLIVPLLKITVRLDMMWLVFMYYMMPISLCNIRRFATSYRVGHYSYRNVQHCYTCSNRVC